MSQQLVQNNRLRVLKGSSCNRLQETRQQTCVVV